jgi:hypothetical protein
MSKQYDIPLRLVTPHMTGQKVKDAQWLMAGHNRFKGLATMKDAQIDGDYGLVSAQATKRAKYWLGYPLSACDMVFGQTVYEYLRPNEWRPLPELYRQRRAVRLKAAASTPGLKAFNVAVTQIGYKETPRNWTKYGAWYGFNGVPWCAIFESWCFAQSGRPSYRYAACEQIVGDARYGRNGLRQVFTPIRGDVVVYTLHGDRYAHTAFFDKWVGAAGGNFIDLGGNTGPSSISNGGMVLRQERSRSMVTAFIRVG